MAKQFTDDEKVILAGIDTGYSMLFLTLIMENSSYRNYNQIWRSMFLALPGGIIRMPESSRI
jgi:hypothetical protein